MSDLSEVGLLGLPDRLARPYSLALGEVGAVWRPKAKARLGALQGGLILIPKGEEPLTRAFDALCALILQDASIRLWCDGALSRARYRSDPRCVLVQCDASPCERLCGNDQWSTPYYHRATLRAGEAWFEDCDGIELTAVGMGAGRPLFVLPEQGKLGHVMHCADDASSALSTAIDYCIPAGMREWKGPRKALVYVGGKRKEGVINNSPRGNNRYQVKWR